MRRLPSSTPERLGSSASRYRPGGPLPLRRVARSGNARWWWLGLRRRSVGPGEHGAVRDVRLQRLEAVLFLAREPLSSRKLSQYANLADGTEARTLIRRLNELYNESSRAFSVEEVAGGFQLLSRPQFASWLRRIGSLPSPLRLSAPTMETLAVVAYRQPVPRSEIEAIRGVACGEILRQLMDRDLVRIGGRSEELGRPYLYSTTNRFLQTFGLKNLEELPRAAQLRTPLSEEGAATDRAPANESTHPYFSHTAVDCPMKEEHDVSVTPTIEKDRPEWLAIPPFTTPGLDQLDPRQVRGAFDEDDDEEEEDEDFEDDEEEDDDFEEELDDEEDEDDLEEEEWEEVDDEDLELDEEEDEEDEEEDEDWDDDDWDDDDLDEDEEEEEDDEDWE